MPFLTHAVNRECSNPDCLFRFPDIDSDSKTITCPKCGSLAEVQFSFDLTLSNRQADIFRNNKEIITIFDNIRSVYNVGAIFRTMHGFGLSSAVLCGITPAPTHKNFIKTSMGAEEFIAWRSENNSLQVCKILKKEGVQIISLESCTRSISIASLEDFELSKKIALIVGNEITGVDRDLLSLSDLIVSIPITGKNKSYNVTTAFGIAAYQLLFS